MTTSVTILLLAIVVCKHSKRGVQIKYPQKVYARWEEEWKTKDTGNEEHDIHVALCTNEHEREYTKL